MSLYKFRRRAAVYSAQESLLITLIVPRAWTRSPFVLHPYLHEKEPWPLGMMFHLHHWFSGFCSEHVCVVIDWQAKQRDEGQSGEDVDGEQQSHQPGQEHQKQGGAREVRHDTDSTVWLINCHLSQFNGFGVSVSQESSGAEQQQHQKVPGGEKKGWLMFFSLSWCLWLRSVRNGFCSRGWLHLSQDDFVFELVYN